MELNQVIADRRSIRAYEEGKAVSRETVEEILQAAAMAPSWKNSQTARSYVVMSQPLLDKVRETCLPEFNQKNSKNAPVLIVTAFVKGRSGFDNQGNAVNELGDEWGAYDLGLHNENLVLKARDMGLATLIMGIRDEAKLRGLLPIPEEQQIAAVIALGYAAGESQMPPRKDLAETAVFL